MYVVARKNNLARNLMKMKKMFPTDFDFFPQTFLLPLEYNEFKTTILNSGRKNKTFIIKPEAMC